jgi:hypothetical protein
LHAEWSEIEAIELARGPFDSSEQSRGFSFMIGGRRLLFWTFAIEAILEELNRYAPQMVVDAEAKRLFY